EIATSTIPQDPPGNIVSSFFYFDTTYKTSTVVEPGRGYWIKVGADGNLYPTYGGWPKQQPASAPNAIPAGMHSLAIRDALGRSQTLYFGVSTDAGLRPELFELPPLPPEGTFDARFASQR